VDIAKKANNSLELPAFHYHGNRGIDFISWRFLGKIPGEKSMTILWQRNNIWDENI
jgi:hypothetical protein